jgi:hypothetical protein
MKKSLVIALSVLLIMAVAGNALAASASFSDVPAKHWAYDSVTKLAQAGLIEGYGDGTFRGDKPMSRYEFAIIIEKAMNRYESADAVNKKLIDGLSAEFAAELNSMGARVTKLETKTNVWAGGETRLRYVADNPQTPGSKKLSGSDSFQFRQRVKLWGTINEDYSWFARLTASGQAGNYNNGADGTSAGFDIFAITAKKQLGMDSIRIGRFPLDSFGAGLMSKAIGVDGIRLDKKFGDVSFIGAVNNVKSLTDLGTGTGTSGNAKTLSTTQLGFKLADNLSWRAGYYWADIPGTALTMVQAP